MNKYIVGKWYKFIRFNGSVLQYKEPNLARNVGYWDGKWKEDYVFSTSLECEPATKEDLEELGDEWKEYWEEEKAYTLEDLKEGRVAVINDGTVEELFKLLKFAFPNDTAWIFSNKVENFNTCFGRKKYFIAENKQEWFYYDKTELPTQSVKVFLKELENLPLTPEQVQQWANKERVILYSKTTGNSFDGLKIKEKINDEPKAYTGESNKLIRRFPSGAVRSNNSGRPRPDWISPYAIEEISKVLVDNENDFGACNYMLGIPETACLESLERHVLELKEAILIKEDMLEAKVIARSTAFNLIAMLHTMVLKEKGLYKEVYDTTELITVEQAKQENTYLKK